VNDVIIQWGQVVGKHCRSYGSKHLFHVI